MACARHLHGVRVFEVGWPRLQSLVLADDWKSRQAEAAECRNCNVLEKASHMVSRWGPERWVHGLIMDDQIITLIILMYISHFTWYVYVVFACFHNSYSLHSFASAFCHVSRVPERSDRWGSPKATVDWTQALNLLAKMQLGQNDGSFNLWGLGQGLIENPPWMCRTSEDSSKWCEGPS